MKGEGYKLKLSEKMGEVDAARKNMLRAKKVYNKGVEEFKTMEKAKQAEECAKFHAVYSQKIEEYQRMQKAKEAEAMDELAEKAKQVYIKRDQEEEAQKKKIEEYKRMQKAKEAEAMDELAEAMTTSVSCTEDLAC